MAGLVVHFERQLLVALEASDAAYGPGIYAIFYGGPHIAYAPISGKARPIYVGKATTKGGRTGSVLDRKDEGALRARLRGHRRNLQAVANLDVHDFTVRYLAIVPVWITLAERFLIDHYRPIWNIEIDGFGNNAPGKNRSESEVSWWDTLHPGRPGAARLNRVKTEDQALERASLFFSEAPEQ